MNRLIYVGTYPLASINTELYAEIDSQNGQGSFRPGKNKPPRIIVGVGLDWEGTIDILLHEVFEQSASAGNHRWMPDSGRNASDECLFVLTHPQFSKIVTDVSGFVVEAIPDLKKIWVKHNHKKR